jgi:hypothetical protein
MHSNGVWGALRPKHHYPNHYFAALPDFAGWKATWRASRIRLKAAIAKTPVARVLAPTTRVRTAAEILRARGLVEARGFVAKLVAIAWVRLYKPKANPPAIAAPVRDLKGLGKDSRVLAGAEVVSTSGIVSTPASRGFGVIVWGISGFIGNDSGINFGIGSGIDSGGIFVMGII